MFSSTADIVIDRPIEEVFDYLADMENDPAWAGEVKEVRATSSAPPGIGKRYEILAKPIPQNQFGGYEITLFDRPGRMEWKVWQAGNNGTGSYVLDTVDGGTRVTYTTNVSIGGAMRIFEPLVGWITTKSRSPKNLRKLCQILESA